MSLHYIFFQQRYLDCVHFNLDNFIPRCSQRRVHDCSVFCVINVNAAKHSVDLFSQIRSFRKLKQQFHSLIRDKLTGVVQENDGLETTLVVRIGPFSDKGENRKEPIKRMPMFRLPLQQIVESALTESCSGNGLHLSTALVNEFLSSHPRALPGLSILRYYRLPLHQETGKPCCSY